MLLVTLYRHKRHHGLSVLPLPIPILTMRHSQEKIMAALIFCSDVHKTGPSRRPPLNDRPTGILSISRIPRLSLDHSS